MSISYKILTLGAIILIVSIVSYHWVQSGPHPDPAIPMIPPPPSHGSPPSQSSIPTNDTAPKPGIGNLMTRIRTHLDQTSQESPPSPVGSTTQDQLKSASPRTKPDTTEIEPASIAPERARPKTPVVTFDLPSSTKAAKAKHEPSLMKRDLTDRQDTTPPVTTATKSQTSSQPQIYTVQDGDTFSTIAVKIYGSQKQWIDIAMANPFVDPKRLQIGQTIRLPNPEDIMGRDAETKLQNPGQMVTHVVRPGDSLSSIANRYYHNPEQWRVIFDTNRDKIGPNPDQLRAGQVLRVPPQHIPAR